MIRERPDRPARRGRVSVGLPAMLFLSGLGGASAQEPLFLRIRAAPEPGSAGAALAAREAVWARSEARARAVIATICTGCLAPWRAPLPAATEPAPDRLASLAPARISDDPGLEDAPRPVASEPTSDPSIQESRP